MDILKKIFPLSWKFTKDVANFIIGIILHVLLTVIFGALAALANLIVGWIPVVGALLMWAIGVVGTFIGLYSLVGLILLILVYCKVLKD